MKTTLKTFPWGQGTLVIARWVKDFEAELREYKVECENVNDIWHRAKAHVIKELLGEVV